MADKRPPNSAPFSFDCWRTAGARKPGTWKRSVASKLLSVHSRVSGGTYELSPHEFAALMLVAAGPEQINPNREELDTLLDRQLVALEKLGPELNAPVLPATAIQFFARLPENPELQPANKIGGHARATSVAYFRSTHGIALYHVARRRTGAPAPDVSPRDVMHFYYYGVAIQPSVATDGNSFVARVSILEEDGEATSLGDLEYFANRQSAFAFAARCGTALADDEPMPRPPCDIQPN